MPRRGPPCRGARLDRHALLRAHGRDRAGALGGYNNAGNEGGVGALGLYARGREGAGSFGGREEGTRAAAPRAARQCHVADGRSGDAAAPAARKPFGLIAVYVITIKCCILQLSNPITLSQCSRGKCSLLFHFKRRTVRVPHDAIGRDTGQFDAPSRPSSSPIEPHLGANEDPSLLPPQGPPQADQCQAARSRPPSASIVPCQLRNQST